MREPEVQRFRAGLRGNETTASTVCVYYCRTYYKTVCGGGGGQ